MRLPFDFSTESYLFNYLVMHHCKYYICTYTLNTILLFAGKIVLLWGKDINISLCEEFAPF